MRPPRRIVLGCTLAILVSIAGCVGSLQGANGPDTAGTPSPGTTATPFREAEGTPEPLAGRANCSEDLWISFWGLNDPRLWEPGQVRFATSIPPNASYLFVAYVDGSVGGARAMTTESGGLHVDGGAIELPDDLAGEHAVGIVVHLDGNGDGQFDADVDQPCYTDDGLVGTDRLVIDLERYWR